MGRRIGILGGTFDPIHLAHLVLAERAREQLDLHQVLFVPAAVPPHKQSRSITEGRRRLEMVRLAVAGNPAFVASGIELDREGVSYTVDTLRGLCAEYPADELFLLVGADNVADLVGWREPEEIARLAHIAVACRPGSHFDLAGLSPPFSTDQIEAISGRVIEIPLLQISGTQIRERVAQGRSIRYLVPAAVEAYITAEGLYTR